MNRCREPSPILLRPGRNIAAPAAVLCPHDDSLPGFSIVTDTTSIKNAIANAAPGVEVLEPGYLAGTEIFVQRVVYPSTSVRQFSGVMRTITSVDPVSPMFSMNLSVYIVPALLPR